jgi:hypothetical protein
MDILIAYNIVRVNIFEVIKKMNGFTGKEFKAMVSDHHCLATNFSSGVCGEKTGA